MSQLFVIVRIVFHSERSQILVMLNVIHFDRQFISAWSVNKITDFGGGIDILVNILCISGNTRPFGPNSR